MAFTVGFSGRKLLLGMGITAALVLGTTACTKDDSDTGTVVSITDGDTLVASVNGTDTTIRLLNIDTPETKDPNKPVECLGQEATHFLAQLLPVGAPITLQYDVERTDRFDRTLAAVFTSSDVFVSAEIARAGMGTAVVFGKNTKFLPPVQEAEAEAKSQGLGLFDPVADCTLPAQIAAATTALETAVGTSAESTAASTAAAIAAAAPAVAAAKTLREVLQTGKTATDVVRWAAFTESELAATVTKLSTGISQAEEHLGDLAETEKSLQKAEDDAARAAAEAKAAAEAEAQAKREAAEAQAAADAQAAAEAQAAADAAWAEAERIRNLPPVYVPPAPAPYVPPVYQPPAQNGGGPDEYTGPRCYAPGGKTYRPC